MSIRPVDTLGETGMGVLAALPAIAAIGQTALGVGQFALELKNQRYMKDVQKETWRREDNSIQRRVADLKAAGLSPVLAAGQGAATSAPVKLEVPQVPKVEGIAQSLALMQMKANIAQTNAQAAKLKEDAVGQKLANEFAGSANPITLSIKQKEEELAYLTQAARSELVAFQAANEKMKWSLDNRFAAAMRSGEVTIQDQKVMQGQLQTLLKEKELSQAELDYLSKKLLMDMNQYDLEKWKQIGLPTNAGMDVMTRGGTVVGGALGEMLGGR